MERVKEEVSAKAMELAQDNLPGGKKVCKLVIYRDPLCVIMLCALLVALSCTFLLPFFLSSSSSSFSSSGQS